MYSCEQYCFWPVQRNKFERLEMGYIYSIQDDCLDSFKKLALFTWVRVGSSEISRQP